MPPKKKEETLTRIARLSVGAIFKFKAQVGGAEEVQLWKITGRPTQLGTKPDGRKAFAVHANYVPANKGDQRTYPSKLFNIDFEVEAIRDGSKDFDAIDRRDQPGGPVTLDRLAREQGYEDDEILDNEKVDE